MIDQLEFVKHLLWGKEVFFEIKQFFRYVILAVRISFFDLFLSLCLMGMCVALIYLLFSLRSRFGKNFAFYGLTFLAFVGISFINCNYCWIDLSYFINLCLGYVLLYALIFEYSMKFLCQKLQPRMLMTVKFNLYTIFYWIFLGLILHYFTKHDDSVFQGFIQIFIIGIFCIFTTSIFLLRKIVLEKVEATGQLFLRRMLKILYSSAWLMVLLFLLMWVCDFSFLIKCKKVLVSVLCFTVLHLIRAGLKLGVINGIKQYVQKKYQRQIWQLYSFINFVINLFLNPLTCFLILKIWGIDAIEFVVNTFGVGVFKNASKIFALFIILRILLIFCDLIIRFLIMPKKQSVEMVNRIETLIGVVNLFAKIVLCTIWLLCVFYVLGINFSPLFSNFWILTAGLSFGLQSLMKDLAVGMIIMFEDTFHIKDEVEVAGISGEVEEITLRVLKIRASDGSLVSIPFNKVEIVANKSREYLYMIFPIIVDYQEDPKLVRAEIENTIMRLKQLNDFKGEILEDHKCFGPLNMDRGGSVYEAKIRVKPMGSKSIKSAYYSILKEQMEGANVKFATDFSKFKKLFE